MNTNESFKIERKRAAKTATECFRLGLAIYPRIELIATRAERYKNRCPIRVLHKISCFLRGRKLIKTSYYFICYSRGHSPRTSSFSRNYSTTLKCLESTGTRSKHAKLTHRSETVMLLAV